MNKQKILLINLSKGKLGEENSSFFGSMLVAKIYQAGIARASIREYERKDFYLYVDEFQNVATDTFINILSESRKYGLAFNNGASIPRPTSAPDFSDYYGKCGDYCRF